jgi:hypothetical protein
MKAAELVWLAAHDLESRRWPDGVAPCNVKLLLPPRQSIAENAPRRPELSAVLKVATEWGRLDKIQGFPRRPPS